MWVIGVTLDVTRSLGVGIEKSTIFREYSTRRNVGCKTNASLDYDEDENEADGLDITLQMLGGTRLGGVWLTALPGVSRSRDTQDLETQWAIVRKTIWKIKDNPLSVGETSGLYGRRIIWAIDGYSAIL